MRLEPRLDLFKHLSQSQIPRCVLLLDQRKVICTRNKCTLLNVPYDDEIIVIEIVAYSSNTVFGLLFRSAFRNKSKVPFKMAATIRSNTELKQKCKEGIKNAKSPLEKLRYACLSRGANGIKGLARVFRIMDDDGSRALDKDEFKKGIEDYGLTMFTPEELNDLFDEFDKDSSGTISFDEFLVRLKPPMSNARKELIHKAFKKLDKTGDGIITIEDIRGVYKYNKHPKYLSGEWTGDQVLQLFLDSFDSDDKDGKITKEEFINYYVGVSASVDNDAYFDLMMRNAWKL